MPKGLSAIVSSVLIGGALSLTAFAADAPPAKQTAAAQPGGTKPIPASSAKGRSRAGEDARACLELPTNTEIIKCAEKFR